MSTVLRPSDEHTPENRLEEVENLSVLEIEEGSPSISIHILLALSDFVSSDRACRAFALKRIMDATERRDANSSWQTTLHSPPKVIRELQDVKV